MRAVGILFIFSFYSLLVVYTDWHSAQKSLISDLKVVKLDLAAQASGPFYGECLYASSEHVGYCAVRKSQLAETQGVIRE